MWFFLFLLLGLPAISLAQSPAYGQCGGIGWTGATTCVSGYFCSEENDYYSQCIPGTASSTTTAAAPTTTLSTSTTTSSTAPTSTSNATIRHDVGKLPALGWNGWNAYGCAISDTKVIQAANDIVSLGLQAVGYEYVNIDDCWPLQTRSSAGLIVPDPSKFPNGISAVATEVHALGLKLGIYGDAGTATCSGFPGSLTYESVDADTFSSWGVDYLKYDNCNVPSDWIDSGFYTDWTQSKSYQRYQRMTEAIDAVSNPIEFNICNWGNAEVWTWGAQLGHSWRMTSDASDAFSFVQNSIADNANYLDYVDFYAHNDMDMMEIGNGGMTIEEERTHFAAWAFMKSPILLGTNLENLSTDELAIVKNAELLAFHQDATIGAAAKPYNTSTSPPEYYSGTSSAGTHVFAINFGSSTATMTVTFTDVPGLSSSKAYTVHDMWTGEDIGSYTGSYSASVASHDTLALRIT